MLVRRAFVPHRNRPASTDTWPFTVPCVAELLDGGLARRRDRRARVATSGLGRLDLVAQWRRHLTDPSPYLRHVVEP